MAKIDRMTVFGTQYEITPEIAPLFNPNTAYSKGACVIHDAVLYKFTANHAAGAWTGNDVEAIEVADRLNKISDSVAPEFDTSTSYTAGQYVYKNGVLYRFTADHTGAWTGSDAKTVTVGGEVGEAKSAIKITEKAIFGENIGNDFPIQFENGTYYHTTTGSTLVKYYGGGYDLTRKVIKTTTFNAPCKVVITAKSGYGFTVFTSVNGVVTGNTGLITSYVMTPGNQYGMTLRTTGGSDNISALDASQIIDIKYVNNISESVAPEFSASATYVKGQYAYKDGILYRFTDNHSGAWTGTDAEEVTVGNELTDLNESVSDLKSAIAITGEETLTGSYLIPSGIIEQGAITANGANATSSKRIRTSDYISVRKGSTIEFVPGEKTTSFVANIYNSNKANISQYAYWYTNKLSIENDNAYYIRLIFRTGDGTADITPSDFDATVYIHTPIKGKLNKANSLADDLGIVDYYANDIITDAVNNATDATCLGYGINNCRITINGTNTKTDGKIRTLITYKLYRASTSNSLKSNVDKLIPLVKGHQYKLSFNHISGTASANDLYVILRNSNDDDVISVSPSNPEGVVVWTQDSGGYLFLYSTTANQVFNSYTIDVRLTDETLSRFGINIDDYYKVAVVFNRNVVYEKSFADVNGHAQGMCTDGTYLYLTVLTGSSRNNAKIIKIDTSGNEIASNDLGNIGHMNQLAYDSVNNLILAVGSDDPVVYRIDPATLAVHDYLTLTNIQTALAERSSHSGFWAIAYNEEHDVWLIGNTICYAITNNDFSIVHRVCGQETSGDGQGLYPMGEIIYSSFYNGNYDFSVYDWHGRKVHDFNKGDSAYKEFEGVCRINGELYAYWAQSNNVIRVSHDTVAYYRYIPVTRVEKRFNYCG